ncbi:piggyBac transposable element-derived protein 3-like [Schistocerca serialis cubense]|uniref:piggyBac transposable element-derived protein 3-like n=1 Tax=Schistocerca serialis cubense TaxID=2023355 RepID=UPI00214E4E09|nr:piggyBac transposable element-derived protein 3-like [Schistocerca serialis cubense]
MKQYLKGKPNPEGLKNFVMANTNCIPLDFCMYEGKGKEIQSEKVPPPEKLDVGGRVVLKPSDTLTEKSSIYVDRHFTSVSLLDKLLRDRNITATGTIMQSRIPRSTRFEEDATMRKTRGSHVQVVRNDGNLAIIKWLDNRAIYLASTESGVEPIEKCTRSSKKEKKYIEVPRPCVVKAYNTYMGGVDLLDRMVGKYGMRARTHKWTIGVIHHFIDLAIAAAWLEYRETAMQNGIAKKQSAILSVQA